MIASSHLFHYFWVIFFSTWALCCSHEKWWGDYLWGNVWTLYRRWTIKIHDVPTMNSYDLNMAFVCTGPPPLCLKITTHQSNSALTHCILVHLTCTYCAYCIHFKESCILLVSLWNKSWLINLDNDWHFRIMHIWIPHSLHLSKNKKTLSILVISLYVISRCN